MSLNVADDASLNAKQEERLERHGESAIINTAVNNVNLLACSLNEQDKTEAALSYVEKVRTLGGPVTNFRCKS